MNKELRKAEIIRLIKSMAEEDGGNPPGQEKFQSCTGIKHHEWRAKLWRTWSDALAEAGYAAKEWVSPLSDDRILSAVADLARRLGKFPNSTDLRFEASNSADFPAWQTINRRWTMVQLGEGLRDYAKQTGDLKTAAYCGTYLAKMRMRGDAGEVAEERRSDPVLGHVYMIRYGKDYKIGRTSSLIRRSRQIQIELPEATDLVHAILTDDPVGVEAYWHRRLEQYRGNGEWFRLPKNEVAAFRKWTKIA